MRGINHAHGLILLQMRGLHTHVPSSDEAVGWSGRHPVLLFLLLLLLLLLPLRHRPRLPGRTRSAVSSRCRTETEIETDTEPFFRFDHLHQPRDGSVPPGAGSAAAAAAVAAAAATTAPLGRHELRRLRLSDQSLDWEGGGGRGWGGGSSSGGGGGGGGGGTTGDDEEFASAWGGSSWGGRGDGLERGSRESSFASALGSVTSSTYGDSSNSRLCRTPSGESEYFDVNGSSHGGEPLSPERWKFPPGGGGAEAGEVAVPQPGGEDTGSGEESWHVGVSAHWAAGAGDDGGGGGGVGGGDDSSDDGLEFQDARDPVSEVKRSCFLGFVCAPLHRGSVSSPPRLLFERGLAVPLDISRRWNRSTGQALLFTIDYL